MKIAVLSTQVYPVPPITYGGLERQAFYQAEVLTKLGHDVTVFSPIGAIAKGWKVYETGHSSVMNPEKQAYKQYRKELKDFDFIIDNSWMKWSMTEYQNTLGISHGHLAYFTHPPYGVMAGVSEWHVLQMVEQFMRAVALVYNAIESPFKDSGKHEDYLLYMSRFSPYKGAKIFIKMCENNHRKGILIGGTSLVESKEFIDQVRDEAKKVKDVEFRGDIEEKEKMELLEHADILISPLMEPYREIFGMNLVEAMGVGTIPYATLKGATEEVIAEGGYTTPNIFNMIINSIPPVNQELRNKAVNRAKRFDKNALSKSLENILERYIGSKDVPKI